MRLSVSSYYWHLIVEGRGFCLIANLSPITRILGGVNTLSFSSNVLLNFLNEYGSPRYFLKTLAPIQEA